MPIDPSSVPDFDDLPRVEGMPQGCAWGVFDQDGIKDKIGTLNFLTPDIVRAAAAEVKDGVSISLNWPLNGTKRAPANPMRIPLKHDIISVQEVMTFMPEHPRAWDDELRLNTQASSQWDSLVHVQDKNTGQAYNGHRPTKASLSCEDTAQNELPTLDHWHDAGAMAARGVLIDYKAYADEKGIACHSFGGVRISVKNLEECAAHQGVQFKQGDVLLVRTGATDTMFDPTPEDTEKIKTYRTTGLEGNVDMARWIWNKRFSAVASDNIALEAMPGLDEDGNEGGLESMGLHQYLLSSFGMSIGELWDFKKLSEYCKKTKRYSFMLTSVPLNVPCLVGSPPNALAIF